MKIHLSIIPIVLVGVGLILGYSTAPIFVVDHSAAATSRSNPSSASSYCIIPAVDGFQQSYLYLYHHHEHHYHRHPRQSNKRHNHHLQQDWQRQQCNHNSDSKGWQRSLASSSNSEDDGAEEREEEIPTSTTTMTAYQQQRILRERRITPNSLAVRHLMDVILRRYGENGDSDGHRQSTSSSTASFPHEWKKTRNYLYKTDLQTLSDQQVLDVMMFLDTELGLSTEVCCHIVQEAPRLLRRPVDSMLRPTANFLKSLWGDDRLEEALKKNPNLLLTSGLGYVPHNEQKKNKRCRRQRQRNKTKSKEDGNDNHFDDDGTTMSPAGTTMKEYFSDSHSNSTMLSSSPPVAAEAAAIASIKASTESERTTGESQATSNEATTIEDILLSRCGFTNQQVTSLKKSKPFVFSTETSKAMTVIDFLEEVLKPLYCDNDGDDASSASSSMMTTIRKIIQTHPTMLGLIVDRALRPKLTFLSERLGGGGSFNTTTTMTNVDIAKIVMRSSGNVLELSIEKNLRPTIDYLLDNVFVPSYPNNNKNLRIDRQQINYDADVDVDDHPLINVQEDDDADDENRSRTINQQDRRQRQESLVQLKKCLLTHPQILCLNLSNLQKKVDYFHSIGGNHKEAGVLLASRIAVRCPQVYSLKLERIQQSVDFLSRVWGCHTANISVGVGDEGDGDEYHPAESSSESKKKILVKMISEYPNVLTLSIEGNLQPTCNFYNQTGYTSLNENWELMVDDVVKASEDDEDDADMCRSLATRKTTTVKRNNKTQVRTARIRGRHIAASLYQRLLPRWRFCSIMNLEIVEEERLRQHQQQSEGSSFTDDDRLIAGPRFPSMDLLVMADDAQFCKSLEFDYDRYVQFKREEGPRLRFSSQFDVWLKTGRPIDL